MHGVVFGCANQESGTGAPEDKHYRGVIPAPYSETG